MYAQGRVGGREGVSYRVTHIAYRRKIFRYSERKSEAAIRFPRRRRRTRRGGPHPESWSYERTFMCTVEGPSALPSLLLFWVGPGTLLPSHNCHPTQSFVLRDVQGLPFVSPDTRCPSPLHLLPPSYVGLSRRFFTARAILVFFLGAPYRRFPASSTLTLPSHVFFSPV